MVYLIIDGATVAVAPAFGYCVNVRLPSKRLDRH